ncbi:MAG: apolipoprotein N-acyltransferase [Candidatus Eremiobacteraeota bacterium]|nr:apolipoprotein N-acyltransferase [Candidatus Eremiobacteraeota bacterium]
MFTSVVGIRLGVAITAAVALALAFPKTNFGWLAPLAAAGLFWSWSAFSWKGAFWVGWCAGTVFFAINYGWFSHTVGSLVGHLSFLLVLGPAVLEGFYFGLAAACAAFAYRFASRGAAPIAAAAGFTICEWMRSIGPIGVPFGQLGYSQLETPLAVFAAYAGTYGVTFTVCVIGAYIADAITYRNNARLLYALATLTVCWGAAWSAWPARHMQPPTVRVAAIQGNIAQSVKWSSKALQTAVRRYSSLSLQTAAFKPQLIAWPETVITTVLSADPRLSAQLGALARQLSTTLVVGTTSRRDGREYNVLYVYGPQGTILGVYEKRQLVPFAESFPGQAWLSWLPYANLITGFGAGRQNAVYPAVFPFAPLICWESAFADLAHAQLRAGAKLFVIATDDAWFGETAGPYAHAKIAQMRAIEAGTWVVRAASTGISGVIAPDGRFVRASDLNREAIVLGSVGEPPGSVFAHLGPTLVGFTLSLIYVATVLLGISRRAWT